MHARVSKLEGLPEQVDELGRIATEWLAPSLSEMEGFHAILALADRQSGKVGFDPPRGLPPRYPRLGALEDRFDVVPVGVDDEGGIVVGVVALAQAWGPVITPPAGQGGGVEVSHRLGIRSDEGEVERRAGRLPLDERQVLGVRRPQDHGGSPRLRRSGHVGHLSSQWLQSRSVEFQGAREVGDLDDYVIEKGGRTSHKLMVLLERLRGQAREERPLLPYSPKCVEGEFCAVHIDNPAYIALREPRGWLLRAFTPRERPQHLVVVHENAAR